jgi:hypothetical protein
VLLVDSARAIGAKADRTVWAADSVTAQLLRRAGHPLPPPPKGTTLCPGSSLASDAPAPGPRGYFVRVEVGPGSDPTDTTVRHVHITHSCQFMYRGAFSRGGVFATTEIWAVRLQDGRWQVDRLLARAIT